MTQLLVSVRNAAEVELALAGGASLIDVKEPRHGSLGRAEDATLAEVVRAVGGRRPVSAALGELLDGSRALPSVLPELGYVKWGLSGSASFPVWERAGDVSPLIPSPHQGLHAPRSPRHQGTDVPRAPIRGLTYPARQADSNLKRWQLRLAEVARQVQKRATHCQVVAVAYADWQRAQSPPPEEVCTFAVEQSAGAFLLDTWQKDGTTLLDWLTPPAIERLCERCRAGGVRVALAGSLGRAQLEVLKSLQPDWFAVRGAVCRGNQRWAAVDEGKVRELVELLA